MRYLTVQDMLWINLQVTGQPQKFVYATLEEATFTQYVYGDTAPAAEHAARFLTGWAKFQPFAIGNELTGAVAFLTFLKLNGLELSGATGNPIDWTQRVNTDRAAVLDAITESHDSHGEPIPARSIVKDILALLPVAV
jgi:death-on-curing protein